MIYNLLKRIQNLLASKPSGTKEEQEILSLVSQALPAMLNGHDTETLAANELLYGYAPTPNGRSSYAITATGSACACTMGRRKRMPSTWTYGCVPTVESVTATTSCRRLSWTLPTMPGRTTCGRTGTPVPSMPRSSSGRKNSRLSMRALIGMRRTTSLPSTGFTRKRQNK
jgi:hypothetical protein